MELFDYLEKKHAKIYSDMGKPSVFFNSTPANNSSFLKFLLRRKWEKLNDVYLERLCSRMFLLFWGISIPFGVFLIYFIVDAFNAI
ncbi:hypothetical protein [Colwellia sp. C1TZA3]|uniref:hypothetical protein n=1 Tax=Colwellia sp. C1TZA3 TaxID=2508879 RepID=UPI0011BECAA1|nr:hypothetical protein [Colwellia sp. C1TZA3]